MASIIERAACCDNRDVAASAILESLKIADSAVAVANLSDPEEWRRASYSQRLMEIADWLRGECYAAIEHVPSTGEAVTRIRRAARPALRLIDCQGERVTS